MITQVPIWNKKDENGRFLRKEVEHDNLLPCPFCNGEAFVECSGSAWHVRCSKCYAKSCFCDLPARWNSNKCLDTHLIKKAVKAWNKRVKKS